MAFKMKGRPMERNFPSAFPVKNKVKNTLKEIGKTLVIPGYGANKVVNFIKNKLNKDDDETYTKTTGKARTTQQNLDKKRDLDYKPQSKR
tara:strand:+ start:1810 stop:2079 length:270 start_codon:yes stop_codon:yes gene_type:complete